jgi:hypothetical protein
MAIHDHAQRSATHQHKRSNRDMHKQRCARSHISHKETRRSNAYATTKSAIATLRHSAQSHCRRNRQHAHSQRTTQQPRSPDFVVLANCSRIYHFASIALLATISAYTHPRTRDAISPTPYCTCTVSHKHHVACSSSHRTPTRRKTHA